MKGAPNSITVEKIAASASASRSAWKTRSSARSRRPAPSARETAEETPMPMPLLVVCRISITQGKAGERIGADTAEEESVERDHAGEGQQVEDIGCGQAQQRGHDRALEQKPGPRRRGRCRIFHGRQKWR